ncbi:phage tail assembly chaperone [Pseudomonas sp. 6D_7.1_Bac1]|uniref:phage tail assembly chaperone n=1 Tax=Pseudomonas sp. 6D_7.1_Bac1 TaxID=2971615 RepID=UPI0021C6C0AA|nr:phage tail assembly chaperone [Pseudomonas sp. 6D_7.1_Bac1]MCU1752147.1 phage tail assembly chaperone [Pseudomonas sp. 6D_7.1_Bac1]
MAKFKLIQNPTFKADVMIPRVGGDPMKVPFEFKYRDRTELAALYTEWGERNKALGLKVEEMGLEEFTAAQIDIQVEQIKAVVVSWDFDEKFTDENIRILVSSIVSTPSAVLAAYSEAFNQSRLGNS